MARFGFCLLQVLIFAYFLPLKAWMSSNIGEIPPLTAELAALERLNYVSTLALSFLIESSLFKQLNIKAQGV